MHDRWQAALEAFGYALLDVENRFEQDPSNVGSFDFSFPDDLGPLPPDLAEIAERLQLRAVELQQRLRAAENAVRERRAAVRAESESLRAEREALLRARRARGAERPMPRYIDTRG
ncbi:MAG: hypothetical protein IRZ02_04145 [Acidothermus sp.]|nr:hypothetical protein [Acidothermus sp.]